jgi:hypothetical protein
MYEGSLRWVQASGSGSAWATASAPTSGLIGYVTNLTFTSAQTMNVISDNGIPTHTKLGDRQPIPLSFDVQWGVTAQYPYPGTASGTNVALVHFELRYSAGEGQAGSGMYLMFMGAAKQSQAFTHAAPANTMTWTYTCLGMLGPTASGYLG